VNLHTTGPLPKITIITVTLNSAQTLEKAILSVVNQNYPHLEYIVVDGGSTDGTLDVIRKYQAHITRWVSEKDEGAVYAVNKGIRMASGELIGILAADDFYLAGAFEKIATAAMQDLQAGVFYGDVIYVGPVRPPFRARARRTIKKSDFYYLRMSITATFIRRDCYEQHGLWDPDYRIANDYELMLRLACANVKFHYVDEALVCMNWGGVSSKRPDLTTQEVRRALLQHRVSRIVRWRFELMILLFRARGFLREWPVTGPLFKLIYGIRNRLNRVSAPAPPKLMGMPNDK
jgi:glycosyltransferase involved in cell wall biosynthesis